MRYLVLAILACGCNSILGIGDVHLAGDGGPGTIDGAVQDGPAIDAPAIDASLIDAAQQVDAAPAPNVSTMLDKLCTVSSDCPSQAPDCLSVTGSPPLWCSLTCGQSNDPNTPPANGDSICAAAYDGNSGTPKCAILSGTTPPITWYCAVECGVVGGTDYGTCPNGLTCTSGYCQ